MVEFKDDCWSHYYYYYSQFANWISILFLVMQSYNVFLSCDSHHSRIYYQEGEIYWHYGQRKHKNVPDQFGHGTRQIRKASVTLLQYGNGLNSYQNPIIRKLFITENIDWYFQYLCLSLIGTRKCFFKNLSLFHTITRMK